MSKLWIALNFPSLPLEIFTRGSTFTEPLLVSERQGNRTLVVQRNAAAHSLGVRSGMPVSSAQAIAGGVLVRHRDTVAEHQALSGLAAWSGQYTPAVSLQPPQGLLLEIGSCLSLHHGLDNLLGMISRGLKDIGYSFAIACAPVPHAAWLLVLANSRRILTDIDTLETELSPLPIHLLDQPAEVLAGLELIGSYTLGDCMRLPRDGLARRFGTALLYELDIALGRSLEPRQFFTPPPSYMGRLELPFQVYEAEGLLFAACRLLPEFEGYLKLLNSGVQEFELVCIHEDHPDTVLTLGFAKPVRDIARMQLLVREKLGRTQLLAPVHAISLRATVVLPWEAAHADMFADTGNAGKDSMLLERLRIRLGMQAVFGLTSVADHRPELAWKHCAPGKKALYPGQKLRPVWILEQPIPCHQDSLVIESGPERIESGWWDGHKVMRDYYQARLSNGSKLWVYYEHRCSSWFVHGLFA